MDRIHGRTLHRGSKLFYRVPGKKVHTETIGDEKRSAECPVGGKWK